MTEAVKLEKGTKAAFKEKWTLLAFALVVLGEGECKYLGPDLAELNMPEEADQ